MSKQPRSERTERTLKKIYEAFWTLYTKKDISHITVNAVTTQAGIHRSTFYLYFDDVYDLLKKAEAELLNECEALPDTVREKMDIKHTGINDMIVSFYIKNIEKINALMGATGDPSFIFELKKRLIPVMFSHFGVSEDDEDLQMGFDYMITATLSLLSYSYRNDPHADIEVTMRRIHVFIAVGILPLVAARTTDPAILEKLSDPDTNFIRLMKMLKHPIKEWPVIDHDQP